MPEIKKRAITGNWPGRYMLRPMDHWDLEKWKACIDKARAEHKPIYQVIYELLDAWLERKEG